MKKLALAACLMSTVSSSVFAYEANNKPSWILGDQFESKLNNLPDSAKLSSEKIPWANSFWPHIYGGIAFRWNNYYQQAPSFAPHHNEISSIKDRVLELKKSIFDKDLNRSETLKVISEIEELKSRQASVLINKKKLHQDYFFTLERPYTLTYLKNMTQVELDKLSPSEKFDVYKYMTSPNEDYNLSLTSDVLGKTGPHREYWEGVCNGWTSASLEFHEPEPVSISNKGLTINFGSSDLKALLSYYHDAMTTNLDTQNLMQVNRVGNKCNTTFAEEAWFIKDGVEYYRSVKNGKIVTKKVPEECIDTNPGAFHIVIGNMIGLRGQGFTAEAVRDEEIWNQPVYEYTSTKTQSHRVRRNATKGTVQQYKVTMEMRYANDGGRKYWINDGSDDEFYAWWYPTNGTSQYRSAHKDLEYYIDVDRKGDIIGGMWLSYERPDFLWVKKSRGFLEGDDFGIVSYMKELENLVELNQFVK